MECIHPGVHPDRFPQREFIARGEGDWILRQAADMATANLDRVADRMRRNRRPPGHRHISGLPVGEKMEKSSGHVSQENCIGGA